MNVHSAQTAYSIAPAETAQIAVAHGDGIGPEIMRAALRCMTAAGADLDIQEVVLGEKVYEAGHTSGILPDSWGVLRSAGVLFKGPITTPQGGGYKSLNVTIRKTLGLFANIRPCAALTPFVASHHPGMDVVIFRENEEDLYAGIEHRQTDEVFQCLKLVSIPGTERIIRQAFEYARSAGRRKVSCFSKDNIMKLTDGLFHKMFNKISAEYPEIAADHWIVDIGAAKLAASPEMFDVIVTTNLYGDIISDIAAEISGSVGIAPSANIGERFAMFEAIHGSAPDIAGKDIANPSGLILAGVQMLGHLGQQPAAMRLHNAWLKTIESGIHTADIHSNAQSRMKVGTEAFADAVIDRIGEFPERLRPATVQGRQGAPVIAPPVRPAPAKRSLVGIDIFVRDTVVDPDNLAVRLIAATQQCAAGLTMITNRGVKVWPSGLPETFKTDHWRCRFECNDRHLKQKHVAELIMALSDKEIEVIKTENLYTFNGLPGYSLGQGQ